MADLGLDKNYFLEKVEINEGNNGIIIPIFQQNYLESYKMRESLKFNDI